MKHSNRVIPYVLVAGLLVSVPACTAPYHSGSYYGERDRQQRAYRNGFEEGREEGRSDARDRRTSDYDRHREFRNADQGYSRHDGPREEYREAFRRGFRTGYNEAYRANWSDRDRR
jgi:hypothetical protein